MRHGLGWRSQQMTLTAVACLAMVGLPPSAAQAKSDGPKAITVDAIPVDAMPVNGAPVNATPLGTPQLEEPTPTAAVPPACAAQLGRNINAIIGQPTYRSGKWGVHVESLDTGEVIYSHNPNQYLIPASNIKLFTTAAALQLYDARSPIDSSTLGNWVQTINQRSHNGYADSLLRRIGGAGTARRALGQLGITDYRQADGSGLSRQNLVTPRAVVKTLQVMNHAHGRDVFYRSLPLAGHSGTLSRRFRSTAAQGIVRAKTGTLRGVRALSGYLEHPRYGRLVFSILVNQPGQNGQTLINGIDRIVLQMATLNACYPV
ncbi:MAG: D-alanyl-D-alanine carboxypeptidase [Spirulinaceae cyanobacterium]